MPMPCPSERDLEHFIDGVLATENATSVEAHVQGCDTCQTALDQLTASAGNRGHFSRLKAAAEAVQPVAANVPDVPGYKVEAEIGRGGHGVVFRARDMVLGRPVALKVLRHGAFSTTGERERFLTEARAVARLDHPNVVRVLAAGDEGGLPYLVAEWVAGGPLSARLDGTPMPEQDAVTLVASLARAADHAHAAGIVHRDIKPANVLLPGPGLFGPKLADFGLAKLAEEVGYETPTTAILGTPNYMAPEQAAGKSHAAGPVVDVYALGAVLYELLTGRPPFKGATQFETLVQVRNREPVRPRELRPTLARDLETVCLKCLQKESKARYPTAAALAEDLDRFLVGRPVMARPVGVGARLYRWSRRHPLPAVLLSTLVVVVVGSVSAITVLWRSAVANADAATKSAQAAEERNRTAREALRMYTTLANRLFRTPEGVTPEERAALARALELYEQFLIEAEGGDPDEEHDAAYATLQLADGMFAVGEHEVSERTARRAVAALKRLSEADPGRPRYAHHYAEGLAQLTGPLQRLGRTGEVIALRRESIRVEEGLVAKYPGKVGYLATLGSFRGNLGRLMVERGDLSAAEPLLSGALADGRSALRQQPEYWLRYGFFAEAVRSYAALVLATSGDIDRYISIMQEAFDLADRTVRERPEDWHTLVAHVVNLYSPHAAVLWRVGRYEDCHRCLARAVEVTGTITRRDPTNLPVLRAHADALYCLGLASRLRPDDATARFCGAVGVLERAAAELRSPVLLLDLARILAICPDPKVRDPRRAVQLARKAVADDSRAGWHALAVSLSEAGDLATAVREADQLQAGQGAAWAAGPEGLLYRALARLGVGDRSGAEADLAAARERLLVLDEVGMQSWGLCERVWRLVHANEPPLPGLASSCGKTRTVGRPDRKALRE